MSLRNIFSIYNIYNIYMPAQIKMFIPNGNVNSLQSRSITTFARGSPIVQSKSLRNSMIARVHEFKPGCSSCGKRN